MEYMTERLCLKPLSEKELDGNYVSWLNDKEVCKFNSHGDSLYTKDMALEFVKSVIKDSSKEVYAVYNIKDNIHIGNISLQCINKRNNCAEIAYLFGEKAYWGKGYATEAGRILIKHAFEDLHLHRIYFGTHIENIGMQRVGKNLGFHEEGVLKEAMYKNGKYYDVIIYALINRL